MVDLILSSLEIILYEMYLILSS